MGQNGALSFGDIIKKNVLDQFMGALPATRVLTTLALALVVGLFLLFVYKKTFAGVLFSRSFALSLVMATMITSLIILTITSNLTLSLGMVGALSIVRFRTAVKDSMDTMFLFWSVAAGICLGAQFWQVAVVGTLFIGLVLVILTALKVSQANPYLLVVHFHESSMPEIRRKLNQLNNYRVKSKTMRGENCELTVEIKVKDKEGLVVEQFSVIKGVYDASLLSYQGDVIS